MKHQLVIPGFTDPNNSVNAVERVSLAFCDRKEYAESDFDFPIVLGCNAIGEPVIEDLPTLGNILLFGKATGASMYYLTFLAQLLWARHPQPLDVAVFSYPFNYLQSLCTNQTQYSFGNENEFPVFLDCIWQTVKRRRAGEEDIRRRKVFFVYIFSGRLMGLDRAALGDLFKQNLAELGLQVVVCGETGSTASYLADLAPLFDAVTETMRGYGEGMPRFGVITRQNMSEVFSLRFPRPDGEGV